MGLMAEAEETDLNVPKTHQLEGARLEKMTQNLAYKHILKKKRIDPLTKTGKTALAKVMSKAKGAGAKISEKDIWMGLKGPPNMKGNIADFLWKILQGKLKIGNYWKNIPGYEEQASCKMCGSLETLDHILLECDAEGRKETWDMAERLWKETTKRSKNKWMNPNAMLLAGIAGVKVLKKVGDKNATKKYKDIAAETAWLLWKIRNERTIGGKAIKKEEVKKRWMKAMKK